MTSTLHIRKNTPSPSLSSGGVSGGASGGRMPISVEALVQWTYAVQRADLVLASAGQAMAGVGSQLGALLALGTRVDTSGAGAAMAFRDGERVAEDAATVHEICTGYLDRDAAELVMMHGRLRTRPDPRVGARYRLEPAEWRLEEREAGSGTWLRVAVPRYIDRRKAWYVPVVVKDRPSEVAYDRERWRVWREGLATVLAAAGPRLVRHSLTEEFPEAEPWAAAGRAEGARPARPGRAGSQKNGA